MSDITYQQKPGAVRCLKIQMSGDVRYQILDARKSQEMPGEVRRYDLLTPCPAGSLTVLTPSAPIRGFTTTWQLGLWSRTTGSWWSGLGWTLFNEMGMMGMSLRVEFVKMKTMTMVVD